MAWIVNSRPQDRLAHAILIAFALRVALKDVIADSLYATARQTLEVVITYVELGLVAVKASSWVHAGVGRAAEGGRDAIIVCLAENLGRIHVLQRRGLVGRDWCQGYIVYGVILRALCHCDGEERYN